MRGAYVLVLRLGRPHRLRVGSLGERTFAPGVYAYVGSAMGGLEARVDRHLRGPGRLRWHVDYLRAVACPLGAALVPARRRLECRLARRLGRWLPVVRGFGSSDCRCPGHLFYCSRWEEAWEAIRRALRGRSWTWRDGPSAPAAAGA